MEFSPFGWSGSYVVGGAYVPMLLIGMYATPGLVDPHSHLGVYSLQRVGSIEAGKDADLTVWTGHPLELTSKADKVFIDGKLVYTQKDGFLPWKNRPATLVP